MHEIDVIIIQSKNHKSYADYMRRCLFSKGKELLNPIEFIRAIDEVTIEMKRIGNNINQFAKYANQRSSVNEDHIIEEYNKLLTKYIKVEKRLEILYRKLIAL